MTRGRADRPGLPGRPVTWAELRPGLPARYHRVLVRSGGRGGPRDVDEWLDVTVLAVDPARGARCVYVRPAGDAPARWVAPGALRVG